MTLKTNTTKCTRLLNYIIIGFIIIYYFTILGASQPFFTVLAVVVSTLQLVDLMEKRQTTCDTKDFRLIHLTLGKNYYPFPNVCRPCSHSFRLYFRTKFPPKHWYTMLNPSRLQNSPNSTTEVRQRTKRFMNRKRRPNMTFPSLRYNVYCIIPDIRL